MSSWFPGALCFYWLDFDQAVEAESLEAVKVLGTGRKYNNDRGLCGPYRSPKEARDLARRWRNTK